MRSQWIKIGIVGRPVGLKGEFLVGERLGACSFSLKKILLGSTQALGIIYHVAAQRHQNDKLILSLKELSNREDLIPLQDKIIWAERADLIFDEVNEYLWGDIIGKHIIDIEGKTVGVVVALNNFGASDIVEIEGSDGRKVDLPFIKNYFTMEFSSSDDVLSMTIKYADLNELWYDDK